MDEEKYEFYQTEHFLWFETMCRRCGECCGSQDGDPCTNLTRETTTGRFYCKIYDNRLGPQLTVSGKVFYCIPIEDIIKHGVLRPNCAYNTRKAEIFERKRTGEEQ